MNKIRIALADDHKLIRDGIKALLKKSTQFEVVLEADNGVQLLESLKETPVNVVLLDISMPEMNGIETIAHLKKQHPEVKIIILSMHQDVQYVLKSVKKGASGYLLKNVDYEELEEAIVKVHNGLKHFNKEISEIILTNIDEMDSTREGLLTERELEVLKEVTNGLSTKQIADKLFISNRTVETHRIHIMKKLNAANTAELVKIAVQQKLI